MAKIMPNFIGIGSIKCGTTWISEILSVHPEIFVAHGKELNYFSWNYNEGTTNYLKHFKSTKKYKAIGEYSVSYMMKSDVAAKRIFEFNPNMKLIVSIRNPIDRVQSQYRWFLQQKRKMITLDDAIREKPGILGNSLYYRKMKPYWNLFSDDQIKYVVFDEIKKRPGHVQRDLYEFLGVNKEFDSGYSNKIIGKTIYPRLGKLEEMRVRIYSQLMKKKYAFLITWFKKAGLSSLYRNVNNKGEIKIKLSREEREKVHDFVIDDFQRFYAKTNLDISSWLQV